MEERNNTVERIDIKKAHRLGFSVSDIEQIIDQGASINDIETQLSILKKNNKNKGVYRSAIKNDGIKVFSESELDNYIQSFEDTRDELKLMKFVPASGAASRMFKFLSTFLIDFDKRNDTINWYINKNNDTTLEIFIAGLEKFPFYKEVKKYIKENNNKAFPWSKEEYIYRFIETLLESDEFNFINKPKAVLPFHSSDKKNITPIEEHLKEAALYGSSNGKSEVHFTISENHKQYFDEVLKENKGKIEASYQSKIKVSFSSQSKSTDTIAVDKKNSPFRLEDGRLFFRPGGHGALIQNLNDLDADLIFIKNIDNVASTQIDTVVRYKKALAGVLLDLQQKIFYYLKLIEEEKISTQKIKEIEAFLKEELCVCIPDFFIEFREIYQIEYLRKILDRPIRVCGMVKNEGEPGGGPFWVMGERGKLTLQIVESSQIDESDSGQAKVLSSSTHFNPVDLVCGVTDFKGDKFNLLDFVDTTCGFIVEKNYKGRELKSYELPGLWNGAMANWLTVFVEVPLATFNPVKNVNDLLKSSHLGKG